MCLTDQQLLDVWERGQAVSQVEQSLLLLSYWQPGMTKEQLAELSLGQRDALLLNLRQTLFGPLLVGVHRCPNCATEQLIECSSEQLLQAGGVAGVTGSLDYHQWHVEFRLPCSLDLAAVTNCPDQYSASRVLLDRCITRVTYEAGVGTTQNMPLEVIQEVQREMSKLDPLADVQLSGECPDCGNHWQTALDLTSFLWAEITAWAGRTLRQVHVLASAYGWSESAILSMSPVRRQLYQELIQHE